MNLGDEEHIFALLIDRQGEELWRARGVHSQSSEAELLEVLNRLTQQTEP